MKIKNVRKLIINKRLTKAQVKILGGAYSRGYTDAINDIITDIYRLEQEKQP